MPFVREFGVPNQACWGRCSIPHQAYESSFPTAINSVAILQTSPNSLRSRNRHLGHFNRLGRGHFQRNLIRVYYLTWLTITHRNSRHSPDFRTRLTPATGFVFAKRQMHQLIVNGNGTAASALTCTTSAALARRHYRLNGSQSYALRRIIHGCNNRFLDLRIASTIHGGQVAQSLDLRRRSRFSKLDRSCSCYRRRRRIDATGVSDCHRRRGGGSRF